MEKYEKVATRLQDAKANSETLAAVSLEIADAKEATDSIVAEF